SAGRAYVLRDLARQREPTVGPDGIARWWRTRLPTTGYRLPATGKDNAKVFAVAGSQPAASSQPSRLAEPPVEIGAGPHHQRDRYGIAEAPVQLRHGLEVHAVDAGDERRHRHHRGAGSEPLHDLVLPHRNQREIGLEGARQEL